MNTHSYGTRTVLAVLTLVAAGACGDDEPVGPMVPFVTADEAALDFGVLDTNFGAGLEQIVKLTNTGSEAVTVGPLAVVGSASGDFVIMSEGQAALLAPGASREVALAFDPAGEGMSSAVLSAPTDHDATGDVEVTLSGTGGAFMYAQVDRVGIPTLNTVFNHPPAFSKTDYNVAAVAGDLSAYTSLFETVLGAVGNADPSGTAALLLPDALPVSLAAAPTSFATLTGRALADDAVDVALSVVIGDPALHSDNVDGNDQPFSGSFPYVAAPNN